MIATTPLKRKQTLYVPETISSKNLTVTELATLKAVLLDGISIVRDGVNNTILFNSNIAATGGIQAYTMGVDFDPTIWESIPKAGLYNPAAKSPTTDPFGIAAFDQTYFKIDVDSGYISLIGGSAGTYDHVELLNKGINTHDEIDTKLIRTGGSLPTTVYEITNVFNINLSDNNNFLLNPSGVYSITVTITAANVGQSGIIIITNSDTTSAAVLPSNLLTPFGADILWDNVSGHTAILSYYVLNATKAIVNYVGDFS